MNDLFYLGIIVPTVITIVLFVVFIYCWFLQKARREVLTKKYDPHGKMRRLGLSMEPPPPPTYCSSNEALLPGEDNGAYDVSRSPSTEQEGHGQPMYHTYHDSGISNCLSPSQENDPVGDFAYRACPDSGFSLGVHYGQQQSDQRLLSPMSPCRHQPLFPTFGQQLSTSATQPTSFRPELCPEARAPHQILTDQIQVHAGQPGCFPQPRHLAELQSASVHPNHGVCYGDDTRHPQHPQHFSPPTLCHNGHTYHQQQRPDRLMAAGGRFGPNLLRHDSGSPFNTNKPFCSNQYNISPTELIQNSCMNAEPNYPVRSDRLLMNIPATKASQSMLSDACVRCLQLPLSTNVAYHVTSSPVVSPFNMHHSYLNKEGPDTGQLQPISNNITAANDRPDSQASQSSTTDSEDSGFRSSHCAAHNLSKKGNPLLKPTRRIKNRNPKGPHSPTVATPLLTLNPNNLQATHDNATVQSSGIDSAHRSAGLLKPTPCSAGVTAMMMAMDRETGYFSGVYPKSSTNSPNAEPKMTNGARSDHWPPQSTNDRETSVKQNIDLNDISTHLSWKYQQDSGQPTSRAQQSCHQGLTGGQLLKITSDQPMELVGYSVV